MAGTFRPIQSVDRSLRILETVGESETPVALTELARMLGIDRSSAFRLAQTLVSRGFLFQLGGGRGYVLGSGLWRLGSRMPWSKLLAQVAREFLLQLAQETGETAHLAVCEGFQAVFIDQELGTHAVSVSGYAGRAEPLYCTALGKALLADSNLEQLQKVLGHEPLERETPNTICDLTQLRTALGRVNAAGYATDDEEFHEGVRCVASPIRDQSGAIVAAIGISAPSFRLDPSNFAQVGELVASYAQRVGSKLGHIAPSPHRDNAMEPATVDRQAHAQSPKAAAG